MLRKFLREPLVHFLALGTAIFLLFHFAPGRGGTDGGRIVVTGGKIDQLVTCFSRTWQRPPNQQESRSEGVGRAGLEPATEGL